MAFSYLSLRVVENSEQARLWNKLLQELERRTLRVTTPLMIQEGISGGSMLSIIRPLPGGGGGAAETFTCSQSGALEVTVKGGTVIWHDRLLVFEDSDPPFTIPDNTVDYKIWMSLDTFNPVSPTPGAGYDASTTGWSGYPDQPNPPGRAHLLLCEVTTASGAITEIKPSWHGGDIVWPAVFAFWQ
jgi:hypothetical protein